MKIKMQSKMVVKPQSKPVTIDTPLFVTTRKNLIFV